MQAIKKLILRLFPIALLVLLTACGQKSVPDAAETTAPTETPVSGPISQGDPCRDFTGQLAHGGRFSLSEHRGKVILLNFWATWCGPCVRELPAFPRLLEKYGSDLVLVAVNNGEDLGTVWDFLQSNSYTFPVVLDPQYEICDLYPTDAIPYTLVIGRDGTVTHIQSGAGTADEMFALYSACIDEALAD